MLNGFIVCRLISSSDCVQRHRTSVNVSTVRYRTCPACWFMGPTTENLYHPSRLLSLVPPVTTGSGGRPRDCRGKRDGQVLDIALDGSWEGGVASVVGLQTLKDVPCPLPDPSHDIVVDLTHLGVVVHRVDTHSSPDSLPLEVRGKKGTPVCEGDRLRDPKI